MHPIQKRRLKTTALPPCGKLTSMSNHGPLASERPHARQPRWRRASAWVGEKIAENAINAGWPLVALAGLSAQLQWQENGSGASGIASLDHGALSAGGPSDS